MSRNDADAAVEKITFVDSISKIENANAVIVASEFTSSYQFYKETIARIEKVVGDEVPIAVNSFGASLEQICATSKHPERILAVLYVAPVERTEYVELIAHKNTNESAIATIASLVAMQKKLMVLSKDRDLEPGYYAVQCMLAAISELDRQICEGYLNCALEIDRFSKSAGFVIGFAEIADSIGLDVITEATHRWDNTREDYHFHFNFLQKLVDSNCTGKRSGRGLYTYSNGEKIFKSDNQYNALLRQRYTQLVNDEKRRSNEASAEIRQARLILAVTNAALRCYERNVISSAADGDVGCVFGIGFPPFLGGPFRFADQRLQEYVDAARQHSGYCNLMQQRATEPHTEKFYK